MASRPISATCNDGFLMRLLVIFLGYICDQPWYQRWMGSEGVLYVTSKLCLRCTERTRLNEAYALQFVRTHTSIPVPRVYCSFEHRGLVYILMERLPGKSLSDGWVFRSDASKAAILAQLRSMITQLRAVPRPTPPPGSPSNADVVSGVDGGQFYDGNLPNKRFWGPFANVRAFHRAMRGDYMDVPGELTTPRAADLRRLIAMHEGYEGRPPVLTHGDLSANNILADGDTITGIVDWEMAGWMPEYWEYTNAWHVNPFNLYWQAEVDRFLEPRPAELEMERLRRRFFGVF